MSVCGSVCGAVTAKKSAMAAVSEQMGTRKQAAGHEGEGGEGGKGVVLLAGGEGEEAEDEGGPEEEGEGGFVIGWVGQRRNTGVLPLRFAQGQDDNVLLGGA
jgi:hypothetical protein